LFVKVRNWQSYLVSLSVFIFQIASTQAQSSQQVLARHLPSAVVNGQAKPLGQLPATQPMNLSIVLPLRNQAELASLLKRIYDPSSPDYHHFLSVQEFTDQFGPTADDYQKVVDFAKSNGFTVHAAAANRMVVSVSGTARQTEKAFAVKMGLYQHATEKREFFSSDREPSVPFNLKVSHVVGLNNFSTPRPLVTKSATAQPLDGSAYSGSGPGGLFLGSDIRAAYYGGSELTGKGQIVGLLEFDGYSQSDVDLTFSSSGKFYSVPIENVLVDGATGAACQWYYPCDDTEQVVDIVQAIGMAPGLSQVRVYIGAIDVDILNAIATENLAKEISISWAWTPDDPTSDDPIFEEFAAQGQSVFVATGDSGSYVAGDYAYPAESAYVTAVGGTDLVTTGPAGSWSSETAWSRSGGGISPDGISIPNWQAGVANATNGASATLRNIPDVASEANTDNYFCAQGSCSGAVGGTSLAAPRWAAFIALANEQAWDAGDPLVGLLNPALYALAEGANGITDLHDIVSGNNDYTSTCNGQPYCEAVPGYDLVTGWGSPAGQPLIDALAPLPSEGFALSSSSNTLTISPGSSASTIISVVGEGGFAGNVNFTVTGLPAGITASWSANPATASSQLNFTVGATAQRGSYGVTITGTSGTMTASTVLTLGVNAAGFAISAAPANLTTQQGGSVSTTIDTAYFGGLSGSVNLAFTTPLPSGVTATWVNNPTTGSSTVTLNVAPSVPLGTTMLTISGVSGGLSATTTISLAVSQSTVLLSVSPTFPTVTQGGLVTTTVTAVPWGTPHGAFNLAANSLPSGVSVTFNPTSISAGQTSQITITTDGTTPVGLDSFALAAYPVSSSDEQSGTGVGMIVSATPQPIADVSISPGYAVLPQGGTATINITVNGQNGFSGSEYLRAVPPSGVTASISQSPTSDSSVLTLTASLTAPPGLWDMGLCYGTSSNNCIPGGNGGYIDDLWVLVQTAASFSLVPSASLVSLAPGSSASDTVNVVPQSGFNGNVQLSLVSNLPQGVTATVVQNPSTGSGNLTLSTNSAAVPGIYFIEIIGTSGAQTVAITVQLSIEAPTTTNLTVTPSTTGQKSSYILAATVLNASEQPVHGQVSFCDADSLNCTDEHLLGTVELTGAGIALLQFHPAPGAHSYEAVFAGTPNSATPYAPSSSPTVSVRAQGSTTTTLTATGSQGDYTLTANVTGVGTVAPSGTVSFADSTGGYVTPTSAVLGSGTENLGFTSLTQASGLSGPVAIATADFNGDGIPDVAVANNSANTVTIMLGNGDGTFSPMPSPISTGSCPHAIAVGDFNGDGNPDLAVVNSQSSTVTILLGNGDGKFTSAPMIVSTGDYAYPQAVAMADFNGDGKLDLAVANESSNTITILLGNGDGSFTPANSPSTGRCPYAMSTGDFNGDGIPDLAVANACDNTVTILLGNGDGTFSSAPVISVGTQPFSVAVGDFNGDGKLDLAVANVGGGNLSVLLGNGDGTFNVEPSISLSNPYAVAVADFNGDGIPDLAVAASSGVNVFLGNGDGTFNATPLNLPNGGVALATGDFNQDGFPDIVAVGGSTSLNTQLTNLSTTATATATGVSASGVGTQTIVASFPGDNSFAASVSSGASLSPTTMPTTTALSISPNSNSLQAGSNYTLTATVTPSTGSTVPTGSVVFTIGSATQTVALNASGVATYTGTAPTASGSLSLSAAYQGSSEFATSTSSTLTETIVTIPSTTALTISPNSTSLEAGSSYTLTATVTPSTGSTVPTGSVVFTIGSATQTVALNASGVATYTTTAPVASGSLSLSATYQGSTEFATSTSNTLSETITAIPSTTALTISPNAASLQAGSSYTLTATVTPSTGSTVPTGSVIFTIGSATQTVALNASGVASYTGAAPVASGSLSLSAAYQGSTEFATSTSSTLSETITAIPSTTTLTISPNSTSLQAGSSYTLTATVTPSSGSTVPTGSVIFTIGSATQTVALNASGVATYTGTAPTASGSLSLSAAYQGSTEFATSTSNTLSETITAIPSTTALTISPNATSLEAGSSYTLTATVTPSTGSTVPTGSVIFTIGSATQTVALNASGVATYTGTAPTASGSLSLSAAYQGSTEFATSTSSTLSETITAIPSTTALTISPSGGSLQAGSSYTLTATVTPSTGSTLPTGSVIFTIGSATQTVALNASGVASYTGAAPVASGSLSLSAAYQGSTEFATSTSSTLTESIIANPAPSISSLSPSYVVAGGASFTLSVNGSGFINGSTIFWRNTALATQYVSSTQLTAQVPISDIASEGTTAITVQTPAPGGGTSAAFQFEVDSANSASAAAPTFTATTATISAGSTASYPVTLSSSVSGVTVSCLNLPAGASCSYSSSSGAVAIVTSSATPSGTYQVTAVFNETQTVSASYVLAPFFLLPLMFIRRKLFSKRAWIAACIVAVMALGVLGATGCGAGGSGSQPVQTGPTTEQVTSSAVVILTVK
jgi:hypothetical protein